MVDTRSPQAMSSDTAAQVAAAAAAQAIARYAPCSLHAAAGSFVREVVAKASPATPARAKALLFAASRLASFSESVGLLLCAETVLQESVIERFIAQGCDAVSPASRRTLRSNLRALWRAHEAHRRPRPIPLGRERAKAPYSDAEIEGYLRLAACQPTDARRMRCQALICLGAGAGIVAGELRGVRGTDVVARSGGVVVEVSGARARTVPVISRFQEPLLAAACFAGERLICGGRDPGRRNVSDALYRALSGDPGLPRLQAGRLRSSWLDRAAQAIGLQAFMAAAGVSCSQRLGDIASRLPKLPEIEIVALLGGSS